MLSFTAPTRIAAIACLVCAAPASAQTAAEVLQRASSAIETTSAAAPRSPWDVIASGRLAQAMPDAPPSSPGAAQPTKPPMPGASRGDMRNRKDAESQTIDVLFSDGTPSYLDHGRKRLMKFTPGRTDATVSMTDRVVLDAFLDDRPLIDAFEGADLSLDGTATHDGELCDVLVVSHPAGSGDDKPEFKNERWNDRSVRRVPAPHRAHGGHEHLRRHPHHARPLRDRPRRHHL